MEIAAGDEPIRKESPDELRMGSLLMPSKPGEVTIQTVADDASFHVYTKTRFLRRVWFLLTNPFYYLFAGHWRL